MRTEKQRDWEGIADEGEEKPGVLEMKQESISNMREYRHTSEILQFQFQTI